MNPNDQVPSLQEHLFGMWDHKHILDLDDFSQEEINLVMETAEGMVTVLSRDVKKVPTLRGKTVALMFFEPSTRTRASFEMAAKYLSADCISLDSTKSSVAKGESLIDSLRTLQALGVDVIILRHPSSGAPYVAAQNVKAHIVNAGDGCHAHPSQSLLDIFTMKQHFGNLSGRKIVIIGDILHSRVAHSSIWGLRNFGMEIVLCAPSTLMPSGIQNLLSKCSLSNVTLKYDLDAAIDRADIIMPLRLQKERQQSGLIPSLREYIQRYQLNAGRLAAANKNAMVLHPGPMNEGIEISHEVAYGNQSLIERQVTNGVAIRMALLYLIMGGKTSNV